jgi:hypothetical protein
MDADPNARNEIGLEDAPLATTIDRGYRGWLRYWSLRMQDKARP